MTRASNPWVVLATLLFIYIFSFADRYLITGLVGPIKAEFGVGDGTMGLLMGPAFVLLYVVLGVPFARLADRWSRVRIIAIGCLLWSCATAATGLATSLLGLSLARVGVGVGEAAFVAPAYSLLSDYFRAERRGMAFAILGLATYIGQIAGQGGGPAIAAHFEWRSAFYLMGGIGVVLAIVALLVIREPERVSSGGRTGVAMPFMALVRALGATPAYVWMMLAFACGALSGVAFGYWGPELFARSYGLDPVVAKTTFAVNFGLSGIIGMLSFGAISDRMSRRRMVWPARLSAIAVGAATMAILVATWADSFAVARLLAIPAGLLGGGWSVGFLATLQYILPGRIRAGATALFLSVTTLIGFCVGPWAVGVISESLGNDIHSLRIALSVVIPFGFLAALFGWLASIKVERGRAALDALDEALSVRVRSTAAAG
jgi:MFS family permease